MSYFTALTIWFNEHPRLSAICIGILIGLPFSFPLLFPIAPVGLIWLWRIIDRVPPVRLPTVLGLVFGIKALFSLAWFWSTVPITWLPEVSLPIQMLAVSVYWSTSALWLASTGVILALLIRLLRHGHRLLMVAGLPVAVVLAEYFGAVLFSVFTYGPGGTIGGGFSFGHVGYLFPWLFPVAVWGGVYMVGVIALSGVATLYYGYYYQEYRRLCFGTIVVLVGVSSYAWWSLPDTSVPATIALVQTDSLPRDRISNLSPLIEVALATEAEYVLLPEDSRYLTEGYGVNEVGTENAIEAWRILHASSSAMLVDSGRTYVPVTGEPVQRAYIWDDTAIYTADKTYLAPQGEYMPILYTGLLRAFGLGATADHLSATINYVPGNKVIDRRAPATVPNILFCFESVSPLAAKQLVKKHPSDFIVHPISHSWFHEPQALQSQFETMLRFQAVYAGVPIVSVGNDVRGSVYLPNGTIQKPQTLATFTEGTVDIVRPIPE
jgi:apolipoprotein N-acyltransferase